MQPFIARDHHTAEAARAKLEQYIEGARERAEHVIGRIMTDVPADRIVNGGRMTFEATDQGVEYIPPIGSHESIHDNGLTQLADRMGIPMGYLRHLQEVGTPWANSLMADTLNKHAENALAGTRLLTRSGSNNQLRAVLSDKFKRIDCRPSLDAALTVGQQFGAVVTDALMSDVRASVRMIVPKVREISQGEFVIFGMTWDNSDYGRGANTVAMFALRLWCLNGAKMEQALRQIHLGGRLSSDLQYSERTLRLDTAANVSAIADTTRMLLSPAKIDETAALLTRAANEKIDPKVKLADLRKRFGKGVADKVGEAYNMPDVEELPPGNTAWRWSNAISWVAKQKETSADNRLDLEKAAGDALAV